MTMQKEQRFVVAQYAVHALKYLLQEELSKPTAIYLAVGLSPNVHAYP